MVMKGKKGLVPTRVCFTQLRPRAGHGSIIHGGRMPVLLKHVRHVPVTTRTKPSLHIRIKTHPCSGRRHPQRRRPQGERLEYAPEPPMCVVRGSPPPSQVGRAAGRARVGNYV